MCLCRGRSTPAMRAMGSSLGSNVVRSLATLGCADYPFWVRSLALRARACGLSLPLLVAWVLTNDPHDAFAADHLAFVADLLDARSDFHGTPRTAWLLSITCAGR